MEGSKFWYGLFTKLQIDLIEMNIIQFDFESRDSHKLASCQFCKLVNFFVHLFHSVRLKN